MSCSLLSEAEALEKSAAAGRVTYLDGILDLTPSSTVLDVGCGNGHSLDALRQRGYRAFGVDVSLYRLSRWAAIARPTKPLVVADAGALPFPDAAFEAVVSSGMIEHVGVVESAAPYTVSATPEQAAERARVVAEIARVAAPGEAIVIDCPNGAFPVDFWHGDRLGALRFHPFPDPLLPTYRDLASWARAAGRRAAIEPLGERLQFRQISSRWWGRLLAPFAKLYVRTLDTLVRAGLTALPARLYPYLVVRLGE